jgi:hypothetical protein
MSWRLSAAPSFLSMTRSLASPAPAGRKIKTRAPRCPAPHAHHDPIGPCAGVPPPPPADGAGWVRRTIRARGRARILPRQPTSPGALPLLLCKRDRRRGRPAGGARSGVYNAGKAMPAGQVRRTAWSRQRHRTATSRTRMVKERAAEQSRQGSQFAADRVHCVLELVWGSCSMDLGSARQGTQTKWK